MAKDFKSFYDPKMESLRFQLEILKSELESIDKTVERIDGITQTTKNWAIITWGSLISIAIGQPEMRKFIILTAVFPLLFWYVDGQWRHLQRRATYRAIKIKEFLNDERLYQSFKKKKLVDFIVYDPMGRQYKSHPEYEKHVSRWSALNFLEVRSFYLGLVLISIILSIVFYCI